MDFSSPEEQWDFTIAEKYFDLILHNDPKKCPHWDQFLQQSQQITQEGKNPRAFQMFYCPVCKSRVRRDV